MAVKSKADLEAENAELRERVASITAERDGFSARVVILEAEAASFKATLETVSTGHFESDRRLKALAASQTEFQETTRASIASLEALIRQTGQRTWAEHANAAARTGRAPAPAAPSAATTRPPPGTQPRTMPEGRHMRNQQHHQPQPYVATGKFVMHAPNDITPDQALAKVTEALGCNTTAIHSVRKLSPTRPATLSATAAAAAPSTSANAPLPPPAAANAVFIFTTTSDLAVLAVKGGLRKILRAQETNMFIDDYLDREQQIERKRREPERKALKDAGVVVAWRGDQLWMVVKDDGRDAWRIVPAAPLLPAPPAAPVSQTAATLPSSVP